MLRIRHFILLLIILFAVPSLADGLLLPVDENYPKDLLRNRLTRVTVNIHGLVAETFVYQEFVNEWSKKTDAVYSFPLPPDARATELLYWRNDTTFKAVLKVREQAVNPGTGEGGMVAEVNKYIGRNGIKIELKGIAPGSIQRVQLHYISLLDYYRGRATFKFPLATGDFIKYPLDHLQFTFNVAANSQITGFDVPTHPDYLVARQEAQTLLIEMIKPKAYIDRDLEFWYQTANDALGVDFYSVANDSMDGHFVLFVRPQNEAAAGNVFPRRVIFLLGNSSGMFGYKLEQSLTAISQCLGALGEADYFNVILFNSYVSSWQSQPASASAANVENARTFLGQVASSNGSRMDLGLETALGQIKDNNYSNSILVFTDGRSPIDPRKIESLNTHKAGIFPIGIGEDLDRARLEMTAALNYGFVTYFDENAGLTAGMVRVFSQISQPILKDVAMEYGRADLYNLLPAKIPTTYAGSYFFTTGRYKNPSKSSLAIAGNSVAGVNAYDFQLEFSDKTNANRFAEFIWAKEMIDALEREVEIYGETEALQDSLEALSLKYNIRCRYTAYIADYTTPFTRVDKNDKALVSMPVSYLIGNYPNPFNPTTTIQFYLSENTLNASVKLIRIFNTLGQLVAVIDFSGYAPGMHTLHFDGKDFFGNPLPAGLYFVRLQVGDEVSTIRITLVK
jgi:hypothetical protein